MCHTECRCGYPFSTKPAGFPKGEAAPFGTQPLEQRCSVLYLTARLAGKMRVPHGGHTRFIRQENRQAFVNGNEQKSCSFSVSGGGDIVGFNLIQKAHFRAYTIRFCRNESACPFFSFSLTIQCKGFFKIFNRIFQFNISVFFRKQGQGSFVCYRDFHVERNVVLSLSIRINERLCLRRKT